MTKEADADEDRRKLVSFLEPQKNVAELNKNANAAEKRQVLEFATSNRIHDGEKLTLKPS